MLLLRRRGAGATCCFSADDASVAPALRRATLRGDLRMLLVSAAAVEEEAAVAHVGSGADMLSVDDESVGWC